MLAFSLMSSNNKQLRDGRKGTTKFGVKRAQLTSHLVDPNSSVYAYPVAGT